MNRNEFMQKLECLLWDLPENDRLDAIAYYNDYFDEAGKENEEVIIRELGSPEKVAATIKDGLDSATSIYGEYTEQGYSKGRSAEEWKSLMRQQPRKNESQYGKGGSYAEGKHKEESNPEMQYSNARYKETGYEDTGCQEKKYPTAKSQKNIPWGAIIILIVLASPILIGILSGLLGGLLGLLGAIVGVTVGTAAGGFGVFIGGLVCFVVGFVYLFTNPVEGLTSMGVGALLISVGILLILLFLLLVSKWIPALVKGFTNGCKYLYRRVMSLIRRDEV